MKSLVWFRRDLRVHDNKALSNASQKSDSVIGLFIATPRQWREHDDADAKISFWLDNLKELSQSLSDFNIPLLFRTVDSFADVPRLLHEVASELGCSSVFANHEYEFNEQKRDQEVRRELGSAGIDLHLFHDRVIVPPKQIESKTGNFYSVFTPYRKSWESIALQFHDPVDPPLSQKKLELPSDPIPDSIPGFESELLRRDLWPAGELAAQKRLEQFGESIGNYDDQRDLPSVPGTSQLSAYLTAGVLSPRQCLTMALAKNGGQLRNQDGPSVWISELVWRDFYSHVLVGFPRVSKHLPFKRATDEIPWRQNQEEFEGWCRGETGYPLVDAGMRQLNETGWMHNRLRMVTAMFLTKNLLIDWRWGEKYFMKKLVDGDLAANNGGWQWSASTGTDAVPYFRIFNPFSQSKRFDPEGHFIHQQCPELKAVPAKALHDPEKLKAAISRHRAEYPEMIVDYRSGRERALAAFKSLKK